MTSLLRRCSKAVPGCIAAVLSACASPRSIATFQAESGRISLQQSAHGESYSVSVGPHTSLPLEGYTAAHIDSIWDMSSARFILIRGAGADCQRRYTLVMATGDAAN